MDFYRHTGFAVASSILTIHLDSAGNPTSYGLADGSVVLHPTGCAYFGKRHDYYVIDESLRAATVMPRMVFFTNYTHVHFDPVKGTEPDNSWPLVELHASATPQPWTDDRLVRLECLKLALASDFISGALAPPLTNAIKSVLALAGDLADFVLNTPPSHRA